MTDLSLLNIRKAWRNTQALLKSYCKVHEEVSFAGDGVLHADVHASFQVKGKVNALSVDSCQRMGILFEDLVSSCELVNSSRVQIQVTGVVPIIAIDKCDSVQVGNCLIKLGMPALMQAASCVGRWLGVMHDPEAALVNS